MRSFTASPNSFETIGVALCQRRRLQIWYYVPSRKEVTFRTISPQRLSHYDNRWYVDAWCEKAQELRTFAVENIRRVELLHSEGMNIPVEEIEAKLDGGYGIFHGANSVRPCSSLNPTSRTTRFAAAGTRIRAWRRKWTAASASRSPSTTRANSRATSSAGGSRALKCARCGTPSGRREGSRKDHGAQRRARRRERLMAEETKPKPRRGRRPRRSLPKELPEIFFCGDPHGEFAHINEAAREYKPKAMVILGDMQPPAPLEVILAEALKHTEIWWIPGNHDTDTGRVLRLSVALRAWSAQPPRSRRERGGSCASRAWAGLPRTGLMPDGQPNYFCPATFIRRVGAGNIWRGVSRAATVRPSSRRSTRAF